jgi:hypothetical protein
MEGHHEIITVFNTVDVSPIISVDLIKDFACCVILLATA